MVPTAPPSVSVCRHARGSRFPCTHFAPAFRVLKEAGSSFDVATVAAMMLRVKCSNTYDTFNLLHPLEVSL